MNESSQRMLTVDAALARVLADVVPVTDTEHRALLAAHGAVLAAPLSARTTQPPFHASAMDGYAVRAADVAVRPASLRLIGESAAGRGFAGTLTPGDAVRIFTGAPIPAGADAIVIQEDAQAQGDTVMVTGGAPDRDHIRPMGGDFTAGGALLSANVRLTPRHLTLAAAAGYAEIIVRRRPIVAILATGDELVPPGTAPARDQIVCSNPIGVAAMVSAAGGEPRLLGIAADTRASLADKIAAADGCDILVTLGGASVGDHDLVGPVLKAHGMDFAFWKIAMRPGKPMLFGRLGTQRVLGLPGNPVSSLITARLFLVPLVRAMLGLEPAPDTSELAILAEPLPANGPRAHYMRGQWVRNAEGHRAVAPALNQDSSLLTPLAAADILIIRPIGAPALAAGDPVPILPLDF